MSEYILKTNHVFKSFKKTRAVKDLTMSVRKNSVYGLLGPNGAGKSTLLKMITGIITPDSGEILLAITPDPEGFTKYRFVNRISTAV